MTVLKMSYIQAGRKHQDQDLTCYLSVLKMQAKGFCEFLPIRRKASLHVVRDCRLTAIVLAITEAVCCRFLIEDALGSNPRKPYGIYGS